MHFGTDLPQHVSATGVGPVCAGQTSAMDGCDPIDLFEVVVDFVLVVSVDVRHVKMCQVGIEAGTKDCFAPSGRRQRHRGIVVVVVVAAGGGVVGVVVGVAGIVRIPDPHSTDIVVGYFQANITAAATVVPSCSSGSLVQQKPSAGPNRLQKHFLQRNVLHHIGKHKSARQKLGNFGNGGFV